MTALPPAALPPEPGLTSSNICKCCLRFGVFGKQRSARARPSLHPECDVKYIYTHVHTWVQCMCTCTRSRAVVPMCRRRHVGQRFHPCSGGERRRQPGPGAAVEEGRQGRHEPAHSCGFARAGAHTPSFDHVSQIGPEWVDGYGRIRPSYAKLGAEMDFGARMSATFGLIEAPHTVPSYQTSG